MFFTLSKLFWFFLQPINLIGITLLLAIILQMLRWRRLALGASSIAFLVLALSVWTSLGPVLLQPLEDRYKRPDPAPQTIAGIIMLGGGFQGGVNLVRGGYELGEAGDRIVETAILARRYPDAKIVLSGGNGSLLLEGEGDADSAPRLLAGLGIGPERLIIENRSRNTIENAEFSRELVQPKPGEVWLLVTSAFHMPRSMALFHRAGFETIAWPADYRTKGNERFGLPTHNPIDLLSATSMAVREWIGLFAYWMSGKIDHILPGPAQATALESD